MDDYLFVDIKETDADVAYAPTPGCCADCDEALDFAAWEAEVS